MQRVNPRGHMKRAYRYHSQTLADRDSILDGIESGIHHLHSLGLIHNDINPSNIMLNGNIPVIIDFNSCRPTGESLDWIGRTYEWYDEDVQSSIQSNDLNALNEIREWLTEKGIKTFKFKE